MPLDEVSPSSVERSNPELTPGRQPPPPPLLRRIADLKTRDVQPETVHRLPHARVVFADYELLQHDFPQLREERLAQTHPELRGLGETNKRVAVRRRIDEWLLKNVAFISGKQAQQETVNTRIEVAAETAVAFRPPHYGRALVYSVAESFESTPGANEGERRGEGLIDVKGTGVSPKAEPRFGPHADGLIKLGDAIREAAFQKLIDAAFHNEGAPFETVPAYAVIDPGFDCKHHTWTLPAGLLVRRAHRRPAYRWGTKEPESPAVPLELKIEFLLRRYGITSVSPATTIDIAERDGGGGMFIKYGFFPMSYNEEDVERIKRLTNFKGEPQQFDGVCLQFTHEVEVDPPRAQLIDFGGYFIREKFENPVVSLVSRRIMRLGEIVRPDDERFTQPVEKFISSYRFGGTIDANGKFTTPQLAGVDANRAELQMSDVRLLAHNLALEYRAGRLDGEAVLETLNAYVEDVTSRWK